MRARMLSLGRSALFGSMAVFAVAFLLRLVPVLVRSSLLFLDRYDDGVYYASADALTFGRVPYADFVLLHPPGITLALVPFAALGRITTDTFGLEAARVAFMAIGAVSAVLVFHIGRRWGMAAAWVAGLGYAVLWPAVYSERATMLEPLAGTALLVGVLLLVTHRPDRSSWRLVAVGVVLGIACSIKLWYLAPAAAFVLWAMFAWGLGGALRRGLRVVVGGVVAVLVVAGGFAIIAHASMWRMVVVDQLRRTDSSVARDPRIPVILGSGRSMGDGVDALGALVTVLVALVVIAAALVCLTDRYALLLVLWLVVGVVVLLATPVFYTHYAVFLSAPEVLVVAIGLSRLAQGMGPSPRLVLALGVGIALAASAAYAATGAIGRPFPGPQLADGAPAGCITSDSPVLLAMMNRLSSDLRQGCQLPVDVGGLYLDTDDMKVAGHPEVVSRPRDEVYQDRLRDYLTSGSAFVLVRQTFANESEKTRRALESHPVIKDVDGFVLRSGNIVIPEPEHSLRQRPSSSSASTPPGAGGRGRSRHHGAAPAAP